MWFPLGVPQMLLPLSVWQTLPLFFSTSPFTSSNLARLQQLLDWSYLCLNPCSGQKPCGTMGTIVPPGRKTDTPPVDAREQRRLRGHVGSRHFLFETPLASAECAWFRLILLCSLSVTTDHGEEQEVGLGKRFVRGSAAHNCEGPRPPSVV